MSTEITTTMTKKQLNNSAKLAAREHSAAAKEAKNAAKKDRVNETPSQKFSLYIIKLNSHLTKYNEFKTKVKIYGENSWNHRGEPKKFYAEILLKCIELNWNNIFVNEPELLNIKDRCVQEISIFLTENQELCQYVWATIIKQHIDISTYHYQKNNKVDIENIRIIKKDYLNGLERLRSLFSIAKDEYDKEYSFRKRQYINKYVVMSRLENIRPLFLYINKNYYKLFDFTNSYKSFLRNLLHQIKNNSQIITDLLNSSICGIKFNELERNYMILANKTLQQTCNLINSKYTYTVGLALNRLFNKDIALTITEYL
jgi:hypothetical protein